MFTISTCLLLLAFGFLVLGLVVQWSQPENAALMILCFGVLLGLTGAALVLSILGAPLWP